MKPTDHIEVIRSELDTMTNEHPVEAGSWLTYSVLLNSLDNFEHDVRRTETLKGMNDGH
jgi:hypothetical protein